MSGLELQVDSAGLGRMANLFAIAGKNAPAGLARALNSTGPTARTMMARVLAPQTGLKPRVIRKALREQRASVGSLTYAIRSKGGNIRLKFFGARETRKGVSAAPWGHRRIYAGTFTKGGRFPNRVPLNRGGQVFRRAGAGRLPLELVRSGLFIPQEMVTGETAAAFYHAVERELPNRLAAEVARLLPG
jgi:hypothetical protein